MATDNKTGMDTRTKATIGIMVVVVLIIIWQVIGLFSSGGSSTSEPTPPAAAPQANAAHTAGTMPATPGAPAVAQDQAMGPRQATIQANAELLKLQQETEKKYITALNELQMLKVQLEIALANQAIAASKLSTVTSEKNIADILTKPAPAPVSVGAYASNLVSPLIPGQTLPTGGRSPLLAAQTSTTTTTTTVNEPSYVVLSVSEQGGRWNAVIGNAGKLYNVTIGDTLQTDGASVVSINKEGVILEKDGRKRKLAINSSI